MLGRDGVARQPRPAGWHTAASRVDGHRTLERCDTQARIRLKAPDLVGRPRRHVGRDFKLLNQRGRPRHEYDFPAPGPNLDPQCSVLIELCGQIGRERLPDEARQQAADELELTALSGHVQFDVSFQRNRQTVHETPIHVDAKPIFFRHRIGADAEPDAAAIELRAYDRLPVEH